MKTIIGRRGERDTITNALMKNNLKVIKHLQVKLQFQPFLKVTLFRAKQVIGGEGDFMNVI